MFNPIRAVRSGYASVCGFFAAVRSGFRAIVAFPGHVWRFVVTTTRRLAIGTAVVFGLMLIGTAAMALLGGGSTPTPASRGYVSPPVQPAQTAVPVYQRTPAVEPLVRKPSKDKAEADVVHVKAYTREDGTHVKAHTRSKPGQ